MDRVDGVGRVDGGLAVCWDFWGVGALWCLVLTETFRGSILPLKMGNRRGMGAGDMGRRAFLKAGTGMVAGWSARFATLNKDWQDMVIHRTQQMM